MKVAVITTSRADYGIYNSLLNAFAEAEDVEYGLVVSGTHLSAEHGRTITAIERDGHPIWGRVESVPEEDTPEAVAAITGIALAGFSSVWAALAESLDVVVCLGDRYEMFAAVAATVPFNLPVAHLHGGETTLGAIDDKYRHAITAMSTLHFTATEEYAGRVAGITGSSEQVYTVGAPGLDGLDSLQLLTPKEMQTRFGIDLSHPTILVTLHPETVDLAANKALARSVVAALDKLTERYRVVITLPNADTMGQLLRTEFLTLASRNDRVVALESLGKIGYFTTMRDCAFLLGNTSSGLLEAPSFGKFTLNVGQRQAGRARSPNVVDVIAVTSEILFAVQRLERGGFLYRGHNVYLRDGCASQNILRYLRSFHKGEAAGAV